MRILITGGTGFIGRPLCRALADHELMVLSRNPSSSQPWTTLQGDLSNIASWKDQLSAFQPEACLHLAWANLPDYSLPTSLANFNAGLILFQVLQELQCKRIVVTGTCFEYGTLTGCVKEDQVPSSQGLFAACKAAQRLVGESFFRRTETAFLWARPFFVYGPGQRPTSLIPSAAQNLSINRRPDIRTPTAIQDFIHVDDVAHGLALLATSDAPAGIYNLGSGRPAMVGDLVNLLARLLQRSEVFTASGQVGEGFWANMEKTHNYTGWLPVTSLEDGVRQTLGLCAERLLAAG